MTPQEIAAAFQILSSLWHCRNLSAIQIEQVVEQQMKKAVIYARVSTDEQADKGYSLPTQLEQCRKYAERLGYEIVAEFKEDYSGATPISERPEGKKMTLMLKEREADAVIAYQVDRLSRDIVDLLQSVRTWIRTGIEVHACDVGKVESELDIVLVIKGWQGSDERKKIVERTTRGKWGKAKAGKVVGGGCIAYGYRYQDDTLIVNETESKVVQLIYKWYVCGDENGKRLTHWHIARKLSEMAIPTPPGGDPRRRRRKEGLWSDGTINFILKNKIYTGVWYYGKRIGADGNGGTRPESEQVPIQVPPIIGPELWNAAQGQCERNKQMARRNGKRNFLLRGFAKCGCGARLTGYQAPRGYYYYRCALRQSHYFAGLETRRCEEKPVSGQALDEFVWDYLYGLITRAEDFERLLREAQAEEEKELDPKREQLVTLLEMIAETEEEVNVLAEAVKKSKGKAVSRALEKQIDEVERRYAEQSARRDQLQRDLSERRITEEKIQKALQFRGDVAEGMENLTLDDKRDIMETLNVVVTVKDGVAVVTCYIPAEPGTLNLRELKGKRGVIGNNIPQHIRIEQCHHERRNR